MSDGEKFALLRKLTLGRKNVHKKCLMLISGLLKFKKKKIKKI